MQLFRQPTGPPTAPDRTSSTTRLEAFSDGVFAIAITLLILEIKVPTAAEGVDGGLAAALLHQWPSYLSYITSFLTIGIYWANHHGIFQYIKRTNHTLLMLNILLLMDISFLPFPTALVAEYIGHPAVEQAAALLYSGTFLLAGILFNLVWWYAVYNRSLIDPPIAPQLLRRLNVRNGIGVLLYGSAFAAGFVSVPVCLGTCILLAVIYALPSPAIGSESAGPSPVEEP